MVNSSKNNSFKSICDHVSVFVEDVNIFPIPGDLDFPAFHESMDVTYVPESVRKSLKEASSLSGRVKRLFGSYKSPINYVNTFGLDIQEGNTVWVKYGWGKKEIGKFNLDEREIIIQRLDPYLRYLKRIEGKVIRPKELLPKLPIAIMNEGSSGVLFKIPESKYFVAFGRDTLYHISWIVDNLDNVKAIKNALQSSKMRSNKIRIYIAGLRPDDKNSLGSWLDMDRFSLKVAEFSYSSHLKLVRG